MWLDKNLNRFLSAASGHLVGLSPREIDLLRLGFTLGVLDEARRTLHSQRMARKAPTIFPPLPVIHWRRRVVESRS